MGDLSLNYNFYKFNTDSFSELIEKHQKKISNPVLLAKDLEFARIALLSSGIHKFAKDVKGDDELMNMMSVVMEQVEGKQPPLSIQNLSGNHGLKAIIDDLKTYKANTKSEDWIHNAVIAPPNAAIDIMGSITGYIYRNLANMASFHIEMERQGLGKITQQAKSSLEVLIASSLNVTPTMKSNYSDYPVGTNTENVIYGFKVGAVQAEEYKTDLEKGEKGFMLDHKEKGFSFKSLFGG